MRTVLIFLSIYVTGFILHIFFAMFNLDFLFMLDALLLVLMAFFCAPFLSIIHTYTSTSEIHGITKRKAFNPAGFFLSLPLCVGIAYAYTDMKFEFYSTLYAVLLTSLTHVCWFWFSRTNNAFRVDWVEKTH